MKINAARESYRRLIAAHGEMAKISRDGSEYPVAAWVTRNSPTDVVGTVSQGKRVAIILAEDLEKHGLLLPLLPKQDRLIWGTRTSVIESVDDASRRIQGVVVAYVLTLSGA